MIECLLKYGGTAILTLNKNKSHEKYKEQNRIRQQKYREKLKSEKEESNVTITLDNTQEENKIKNILDKEGDENRSGFRKCEF